jgi:hypothetical protein
MILKLGGDVGLEELVVVAVVVTRLSLIPTLFNFL